MYNDTAKNYETLYYLIQEYDISAETLLLLFTNYHGLQILDSDFIDFIESEVFY